MTKDQIHAEALRLPRRDRARLAEALLSSLDEDADIEAAWAAEIERRMEDVRQGRVQLIDADEVLAELRQRFVK
jgi:putative addiction module component (TIGR02574 family)